MTSLCGLTIVYMFKYSDFSDVNFVFFSFFPKILNHPLDVFVLSALLIISGSNFIHVIIQFRTLDTSKATLDSESSSSSEAGT
jgi:hypothetical protein